MVHALFELVQYDSLYLHVIKYLLIQLDLLEMIFHFSLQAIAKLPSIGKPNYQIETIELVKEDLPEHELKQIILFH